MSTQSQIDANRENAKHSTGPVTEAGKAAASQNRGSHYLSATSSFQVLPDEDPARFNHLYRTILEALTATNEHEVSLIQRLAEHEWMRQRAVRILDGMFSCDPKYVDPFAPVIHKPFALMMRYHTMHERAYHATMNLLLKLRAERRDKQIGFERKTQQAERQEMQKQRHQTTEKARHLDAECKIIRTIRQSTNHPEALQLARDIQTRHKAA